MAEEIFQEQLLSYRPVPPPTRLPDCPEAAGPDAGPASAPATPAPEDSKPGAAGAKPGARPAAGAGGRGGRGAGAPKSNAAAEARVKQLAGEAEVRAKVVAVRDGLARGLRALAALASGDRSFTADQVRLCSLCSSSAAAVGWASTADCRAALARVDGSVGAAVKAPTSQPLTHTATAAAGQPAPAGPAPAGLAFCGRQRRL